MANISKKTRNGITLFVGFTIFTIILLLAFTAKKETIEALKQMKLIYLLFVFFLWAIYVFFDAMKVYTISRAVSGIKIGVFTAIQIILSGGFMSAITPFQTGGFPVQIYILNKKGLNIGKGTLVLLLRGIFYGIFVVLFFPLLIPIYRAETSGNIFRYLFKYSFIIYTVVIGALIFVILKPHWIKRCFFKILYRKRKRTKSLYIARHLFNELDDMIHNFFIFIRYKGWYALLTFIFNIIAYTAYYLIAPIILIGLGHNPPIMKSILLQIFLVLFTFFSPTPGATGVVEGGFFTLFYKICPKYLLGVYTIIWRFFAFYLTAIGGGIVTLKLLKWTPKEGTKSGRNL